MNDRSITSDKSILSDKSMNFSLVLVQVLPRIFIKSQCHRYITSGTQQYTHFFLTEVTANEINKITQGLKNVTAGHYDITASSLKPVSVAINQLPAYLCYLSFTQGIFLQQLKLANVLPLYKKADDSYSFNNYRPLSLLCVLSKVFEKVMHDRLLEFLENHKLLFTGQFGCRRLHSSYMALMILMDTLISSLDKGETVIGIFLDFSKAFFLHKLFHYGIRVCALNWFRSHFVDVNSMSLIITYLLTQGI